MGKQVRVGDSDILQFDLQTKLNGKEIFSMCKQITKQLIKISKYEF